MLNQRAIQAFLDKKRLSFDWIKQQSVKCLDEALVSTGFNLNLTLWSHQKACFLIINTMQRFIVHIGMGGGKTLLTLAIIKHRKQLGERIKAIVFVPYITSVETWVEEVNKHTPDLCCVPLLGTTHQNLADLSKDGDLFVICYQSAVAMVSHKTPKGWQLTASQVRDYFASFNMIVLDEIHKAKSASSLTYRMCRAISAQCDWAIGLTGTPFANDLSDLWPQYNLIDFGETLGPTLSFFREIFFTKKLNYWGGYEFKFQQSKLPLLQKLIKNRSIHYSVDEFNDMPPKSYVIKSLALPEAGAGYSQLALKQMRDALKAKGKETYRIVESNYLRLQQLGSGFMTLRGEDSERLQVKFDENPKLDALEEILNATPPDAKIVVFHHFVFTARLVGDRLDKAGIRFAVVNGTTRDPIGQLRKFKQDPKCRVLVINCKSGSSSLNLQGANYIIFFEQPISAIDRQQAEARCWRPGQTRRVFIYDLLMRGTMDARQHQVNKTGENLLKILLSGKIDT